MKHFKKFFSYLVALTMVLSLAAFTGVKVHAADTTGNSLAITNNGQTAHTFELYQIFTGDLSGKTLSNIKWGNGVTEAGKAEYGDAATKAATLNNDVAAAKAFAKALADGTKANGTKAESTYLQNPTTSKTSVAVNSTYTFDNLAAGYYLVKDTANSQDGSDTLEKSSYTEYICEVVGQVTATTKLDVPSVEKKVKDINDSEESSEANPTDWQDSADYDIGDSIPYKLTATLGTKYGDYKTYKLEFVDNLSKGLTYDDDVPFKVTVDKENGADITKAFHINKTNSDKTITWTCNDLKEVIAKDKDGKIVTINAGSKIIVTYNAKLNDSAVIGAKGNPNTVYLKYSNNPNYTGEGKDSPEGQTPKDKNIVFTYAAKFNKVDGSNGNKPLAGARFTLYKFTTKQIDDNNDAEGTYNNVNGYWHSFGEKEASQQTDGNYTAYYKGLDDGVYKLVESHTPDGYNTMADKIFTVSATHNDGDEPSFGGLTVDDLATKTIDDGTFTSDIQNNSGSILPSTGGMGTTLLYVAGGILVACAAAYVVMSRKHSTNK
ncbi:MAG: SpaH/EbpB family LPXTG-anchored major pilin [Intestinibaculum porci]|uniref:SpaH/EbpB family LPXTG-anchored major pilin n=1 Tax=Intestinibaculum porci TaxID=2487118 RepID=UPI003EFCDB38